jgi:hypothetical protein
VCDHGDVAGQISMGSVDEHSFIVITDMNIVLHHYGCTIELRSDRILRDRT